MIRLTRDGMIVHHSGIALGSWQRTVDGRWQVWGGPRHQVLLAECDTRAGLVGWVEAHAVDGWGMVAALGSGARPCHIEPTQSGQPARS